MKKYNELSEEEREVFAETFYTVWPYEETDRDSSTPWGCPWYWCGSEKLLHEDIQEAANLFFLSNRAELDGYEKEMNKIKIEKILDDLRTKKSDLILGLASLEKIIKDLEIQVLGVPEMPFGKHKGTPLDKLPPHYVAWLFASESLNNFENRDLKENLKRFFAIKRGKE